MENQMTIKIENPIQALKTQLESGECVEFRPGSFMQNAEFCSADTQAECILLDDAVLDSDDYIMTTNDGEIPTIFTGVQSAISEILRWWSEDSV